MDNLKVSFWIYLTLFVAFGVMFMVGLSTVFPHLVGGDNEESSSWMSYVSMLPAFILTYFIYSLIEKGKLNFSNSLRIVIATLSLGLGSSVLFIPMIVLAHLAEGYYFLKILWDLGIIYGGAIILVFVFASILAWINNSSPFKELEKSIRNMG